MKRQEEQLRKWLSLNGFSRFPIESLVVISNPELLLKLQMIISLIQLSTVQIYLIKSNGLRVNIRKSYKNVDILIRQIVANHAPLRQNILEQFKIKKELLHGVQCEVCSVLPMFKLKKAGIVRTVKLSLKWRMNLL